ncbi:MAG: sigma-70 family RNA polymerase sigma factor [Lachnospiraceae bacterium]|nr:sigma-70 family RNA polymerase sigma factor [Lachnospiraceae bacterium]
MNNIIISALDEQFYIDCEVIETKYEYPQYTGIEKWIIITNLTEEELNNKYAEQIAPLRPFIVLSRSFGEVRNAYRRNEKKHQMRAIRSVDIFSYEDGEIETHHPELLARLKDLCWELIEFDDLHKAIELLPETQKRRLKLYYFTGYTEKEIAIIEKCSSVAVHNSIDKARNNLKKFLKRG